MNDRFKFRVWDKYTHETPAEEMQFLCFSGCLVDCDGCHHSPDDYIVEQCTGLKDKNGNLIYEGDVVKDEFGRKFKVIWSEEDCMFDGRIICYDPEFGNRFDLYQGATDNSEIIGNIHKQAEQKDVK